MNTQQTKDEIIRLKKETGAAILAHNYVTGDIQDVADVVADSLILAKKAIEMKETILIVAGVDFMAESVKILNPQKKVIHINPGAKCPMAHMAEAEDFEDFKKLHPGVPAVAYVNTTAALKTMVDYCCTSANVIDVIKAVPSDKVIFLPDLNMGHYAQSKIRNKEILLWPGHCKVHSNIKPEQVKQLKALHPEAKVLVHPECRMEVIEMGDHAASTEGMITYVRESGAKEFIITTEEGLIYKLKKMFPDKVFYAIPGAVCQNMKKMTLEDLLKSLRTLGPEIILSPEIIEKARIPLGRMVSITQKKA